MASDAIKLEIRDKYSKDFLFDNCREATVFRFGLGPSLTFS